MRNAKSADRCGAESSSISATNNIIDMLYDADVSVERVIRAVSGLSPSCLTRLLVDIGYARRVDGITVQPPSTPLKRKTLPALAAHPHPSPH